MAKIKRRRPAARTALAPRNASFRATAAQAGRATSRAARSVARVARRRATAVNAPTPVWQEVACMAGGAVGSALLAAIARQKNWLEADTIAYIQTGAGLTGGFLLPGLFRFAAGGMGVAGAAQVIYLQAHELAAEKTRKMIESGAQPAAAAAAAPATAAKPGVRPQAALPDSFDHQLFYQQHLVDDAARLTDDSILYAPQPH